MSARLRSPGRERREALGRNVRAPTLPRARSRIGSAARRTERGRRAPPTHLDGRTAKQL